MAGCVCVCVAALTLPPQLILHGLHPSLLLDEVVDHLRRLAVLQLSLGDAAHVKQVLQLRVQIVQLSQHTEHFRSNIPACGGTSHLNVAQYCTYQSTQLLKMTQSRFPLISLVYG